MLFQDGVDARRQLTCHGHDRFARGHFLWVPLIDALIELAQFRIFSDGHPGTLNQLVAQAAIAGAGNLTAILFVAGRMFARDQPEKRGNLTNVGDQHWIPKPSNQMCGHDLANARQALEPGD